jgi:hypothetical protein
MAASQQSPDGQYANYVPNSYQKPNVFADVLMRLMSPSVNIILDAACRKILGWEEHRATRRDRISLTQFQVMTGLSRPTIMLGLQILERGNMLLPIPGTSRNKQGQEYELNLGQKGPYDLGYLAEHNYRGGRNKTPQNQNEHDDEIPPTDGGGIGKEILPVESDDRSSRFTNTGNPGLPVLVFQVDPQNQKQKTEELVIYDSSVLDCSLSPAAAWEQLREQEKAKLRTQKVRVIDRSLIFETEIVDFDREARTFIVHLTTGDRQHCDWLNNRLGESLEFEFRVLTGQEGLRVRFVPQWPPPPA